MMTESEYVPCGLCQADEYTIITYLSRSVDTADGLYNFDVRLVCCRRCGLVYWNPRKTAAELHKYYASVYRAPILSDNIDEDRLSMIQSRMQLLKQYVRAGKLLEIGSAEGFFLQKAIADGFIATGIEPSFLYSEFSRQLVPQARIYAASFESYSTEERFNVICSFFVLEHMIDAKKFLDKSYQLLLPNGVLYLEVPDVELYPSQFSDMIWHEHTYHFIHTTVEKLLAKSGFKVIAIHSPGPSYQFGMAVVAQKQNMEEIAEIRWKSSEPKAYYLALRCFKSHLKRLGEYRTALRLELDPLLKQIRARQCKLAVYGTGVFYKLLYAYTDLQPSDVTVLIDDNEKKWGKCTPEGINIVPPMCLADRMVDIVLIASDCFESHMSKNVTRWSYEYGKKFEPFRLHALAVETVMLSSGKKVK